MAEVISYVRMGLLKEQFLLDCIIEVPLSFLKNALLLHENEFKVAALTRKCPFRSMVAVTIFSKISFNSCYF